MRAIKKMSLPALQFKDSQGNNAPAAVNRVGNQGMQKIAKPLGFQDNPALADLPEPASVAAAPASVAAASESVAAASESGLLKNKKKKGRYGTLLTGSRGAQDAVEIRTKSLLGS